MVLLFTPSALGSFGLGVDGVNCFLLTKKEWSSNIMDEFLDIVGLKVVCHVHFSIFI